MSKKNANNGNKMEMDLVAAIRELPGNSDRERLGDFVKAGIVECADFMLKDGWCVGYPGLRNKSVGGCPGAYEKAIEAYFALVKHKDPFEDVLAPVHAQMALDGTGKKNCQHFTPQHLALAMYKLVGEDVHKDQFANVMDPTCGSGVTLLSACRLTEQNILIKRQMLGVDLDPLCAGITALQLMSNQLVHGKVIGCFEIECKDMITEYLDYKPYVSCVRHEFLWLVPQEIQTLRESKTKVAVGINEVTA